MSTRKLRNPSTRTPLLRLSPVPHLVDRQRAALFAHADKWAAEILRAVVTDANGFSITSVDDALVDLQRRSSYYHEADERQQEDGNLMIACQEAGLMLGLAFGLRLRSAS